MTMYTGVIGHNIKHSISPIFQQAAFDHLGLDIRYEVWDVDRGGLPDLLRKLRQPSYLGANVTIPHKESVIPLLDELDQGARHIGAVNTIVNRSGKLTGYNTDGIGFLKSLREAGRFDPKGKRAVLLGAGGAARAVGFALLEAGARHLGIMCRNLEKGTLLGRDLEHISSGVEVLPWGDARVGMILSECDLVVNCTSIGMKHSTAESESPLEPSLIPTQALIYDVVYNPVETPLLKEAKKAGARTLGGLAMLVYQGAASFELWTGKKAPLEVMFEAARKAL